jgi:hypothetical protein
MCCSKQHFSFQNKNPLFYEIEKTKLKKIELPAILIKQTAIFGSAAISKL